MNFLAHFHLAWPDEGMIAGGLEGDYFKGPLCGQLPLNLELGVKLHRAIDAYTDTHPLIGQLRSDLPPDLRRYSGILIDLSFDHYLSLHWSNFSVSPLSVFNRDVYRILNRQKASLSVGARTMLQRLVEYDVLNLYAEWEMVLATAKRIGTRFKRHNPFLELEHSLSPAKASLEEVFLSFYPQVQSFSQEWALNLRE
ncbi:MAG: ACP phosphodiesterase [Halioglobus sp.]